MHLWIEACVVHDSKVRKWDKRHARDDCVLYKLNNVHSLEPLITKVTQACSEILVCFLTVSNCCLETLTVGFFSDIITTISLKKPTISVVCTLWLCAVWCSVHTLSLCCLALCKVPTGVGILELFRKFYYTFSRALRSNEISH